MNGTEALLEGDWTLPRHDENIDSLITSLVKLEANSFCNERADLSRKAGKPEKKWLPTIVTGTPEDRSPDA
jgi:hypothetical protein